MNRRSFLASLAALPFIGAAFKASAAEPTPEYVDPFWDNPQNFGQAMKMMDHRRLLEHIYQRFDELREVVSFEPNDRITRNRLIVELSNTMNHYKSARTVTEYRIVCDETNNTPFIVDNGFLDVDVCFKLYNDEKVYKAGYRYGQTSTPFSDLS